MQANRALTLYQFQQLLGNTIRLNPELQRVWVTAELSDVRISGGHCYMELMEKDPNGNTVAKIRAMIWAGTLAVLRRKFFDATGRDIGAGMKVMVMGSANHHSLYGLSFVISDIDPSYTVGDMERLRREILARLGREGIVEANRKLLFPPIPQRIAVVSASGAAGYGDFINQLDNTPEAFRFYTMLYPAVMQGERTSASVRDALDHVERNREKWDCVVIIRGGGATTDLNGFDDYELARRVVLFPLPVVVGIGHERDHTVLDEIACVRCKTPTAVAAFLIDRMRLAYMAVVDRVRKIVAYSSDAMKGENYRLASVEASLPAIVKTSLMKSERSLQDIGHALERSVSRRYASENERIGKLRLSLEKGLPGIVERKKLELRNIEGMVRVLSPENTLKRGYSITRVGGRAVRSVSDLRSGDTIETRLPDGSVISEVTDTGSGIINESI